MPGCRAARATNTTTRMRAIAATPSASTNMASIDPPCPAKLATSWVPGAAMLGFGAPVS